MQFTSLIAAASLASVAMAQGNFPYLATGMYTNTALSPKLSSAFASIDSSVTAQPAYTSFINECSTVTVPPAVATLLYEADCNPLVLAGLAIDPTTTPAWFTEIPSDMQSYLSSIDAAQQSVAMKIVNGAEAVLSINVQGAVMAAGMAVLAFL